ncbi:hypothetical protein [Variovorax fucosicus]|uniref:hypothetical protein n=1 Tax=Variovorax fucosicus TaxID=3053517 RepID=UPI002576C3A0|nr:hypothetical protein [Variovorax sp. J22G47]MDM0054069.1 hypothetical protein [Variovorax sp. J22G47]
MNDVDHVQHAHPRAFEAATTVDPMILATALDHIAGTAAKSRSQTRRLRWIEQRALFALRGTEYRDIDLDLPKSAGPDTAERLQRRMAYHIAIKHAHAEALRQLVDVCERMDLEEQAKRPTDGEYRLALAAARTLVDGEANQIGGRHERKQQERMDQTDRPACRGHPPAPAGPLS